MKNNKGYYIKEFKKTEWDFNIFIMLLFGSFEFSLITIGVYLAYLYFKMSELPYSHFLMFIFFFSLGISNFFSYVYHDICKLHKPTITTKRYLCYKHLGIETIISEYGNTKK